MEPQISNRSSTSSLSASMDGIQSVLVLSPSSYKTSQSLTSVINTPETSLFDYLYDYVYKSLSFGIEPSAILQDINLEDFYPYLNRIYPYFQQKAICESPRPNDYTIERCYAEIPQIFFSDTFLVQNILEEPSLNMQESVGMYLDIADVSIFNKISEKWEALMNAAYGLETLSHDILYLLTKINTLTTATKSLQSLLVEKYLKIIKLNRRYNNIKKLEEKLKLIGTIKDVQPILNEFMNKGHYSSASQLLLKTQQTLNSKLQGIKSLTNYSNSLEKTRLDISSQLDNEFSFCTRQFIVSNTFTHTERLSKMLKNNSSLENAFKIFPKETNYERINELIQNKISTGSLQSSLQELNKALSKEINDELKKMYSLLGVHKTDENSKWVNISHSHFLIVIQSLLSVFNSVFQKFLTICTLIISQFTPDSGIYADLKKLLANSVSNSIVSELDKIENTLLEIFTNKLKKIINSRQDILVNGTINELKELYELCDKLSIVYKNLSVQTNNSIVHMILQIQKIYLNTFHDKKIDEIRSLLDSESWNKIDIPDEIVKFVMEKRGEAARIAGIKLETPEITATGNLLIFYKILYEYIKISEDLQIPIECGMKIIEILKFYTTKTYELIVEAKAVPSKLNRVTSKHLALSAQGLSFIIQEFPYIEHRLTIKTKDSWPVLSSDFINIKSDYQTHQKAIYNKLCQIIISRVTENCEKAIQDAKWDTMISPSQIDNEYYIKKISIDLVSMHSILLTVLSTYQILEVFNNILMSLSISLLNLYSKVNINSYIPAQRIKNDTQQLLLALREKFSSVLQEPLEELDDQLQKFVNERCEMHLGV
jgi:Vps54-like protein